VSIARAAPASDSPAHPAIGTAGSSARSLIRQSHVQTESWPRLDSSLQAVPRQARNGQSLGHIVGGLVVAPHGCPCRVSEVVVQYRPERLGHDPHILQRLVEARDREAIHVHVRRVAALHPDDGGFVPIGLRVRRRTPEGLGPVAGESLGVLRMNAMAERMTDDRIAHDASVPGRREATQPVSPTFSGHRGRSLSVGVCRVVGQSGLGNVRIATGFSAEDGVELTALHPPAANAQSMMAASITGGLMGRLVRASIQSAFGDVHASGHRYEFAYDGVTGW
jgi:hypothetical protein